MRHVARMEPDLGYVAQLFLTTYPLFVSVFARMDGAVEYSALYLCHVAPPVLDMTLHAVLRQSAFATCRLGFDEIFPYRRLLVYVSYSLHSFFVFKSLNKKFLLLSLCGAFNFRYTMYFHRDFVCYSHTPNTALPWLRIY